MLVELLFYWSACLKAFQTFVSVQQPRIRRHQSGGNESLVRKQRCPHSAADEQVDWLEPHNTWAWKGRQIQTLKGLCRIHIRPSMYQVLRELVTFQGKLWRGWWGWVGGGGGGAHGHSRKLQQCVWWEKRTTVSRNAHISGTQEEEEPQKLALQKPEEKSFKENGVVLQRSHRAYRLGSVGIVREHLTTRGASECQVVTL